MMIKEKIIILKENSKKLPSIPVETRNEALESMAEILLNNIPNIILENKKDLDNGVGLSKSIYNRLVLTKGKIEDMVKGIRSVKSLDDPLGKIQLERELDTGLSLTRFTVPIGVIGVIFESRPDALVQISSLFIKSGNGGILKGGKEAVNTNRILFKLIKYGVSRVSPILGKSLELAESREEIKDILDLDEYIDLIIPRGGNDLVQFIKNNTKIPVMGHTDGICHLYMDCDGNIDMGIKLTLDSKCQYPGVCNAIETLLVHNMVANDFLPKIAMVLRDNNVELRGCCKTQKIISCKKATNIDWDTEYNDYIISIKIISSVEEAIEHINKHGSGHTDLIVTNNKRTWDKFLMEVDSASVFLNASTRFADGNRYGFGAEVGISTNKIHARGPVGLTGLTIYKYKLIGNGDIVDEYVKGSKTFTHRDV